MIKNLKATRLSAVAVVVGLALSLAACGGTEESPADEPVSASEQAAQQNLDDSTEAYEETYPEVWGHLLQEYGITETAELCDEEKEVLAKPDEYKAFLDELLTGSGVTVPEDASDGTVRGVYDAAGDAVYDVCYPD